MLYHICFSKRITINTTRFPQLLIIILPPRL